MEFENLLKLINAVSASTLTGFKYEEKGVKLSMTKEESDKGVNVNIGSTVVSESTKTLGKTEAEQAQTIAPTPLLSAEAEIVAEEKGAEGNIVVSPLVGTFYAAPAEDAEPFVKIGDRVEKGQTLAIVEAMKLMNDIESDFSGEVAEIYVENGTSVEYGQPLFKIR